MSFSIDSDTNKITLTRGDTFIARVHLTTQDGEKYEPEEGDVIRFAMKASIKDEDPLIVKEIPTETMELVIDAEDTKPLPFGKYIYDVELTRANGIVDTFITKSQLILTEEVY